jgi:hypothetical protein
MTRVRTDNVFGTITDNPLTNVATTMNSAGLANLAAVSSAEAIIILDPNRVSGAPEIVIVTAHTASATSATIQRGQFGTAARQHAQGTEWVHGPIASNATSYATAADDQGDYVPMNAWGTWTPTLTNMTLGNGTVTARFLRVGRKITFYFKFVLGSTSAVGTNPVFSLPVAPSSLYSTGSVDTFGTTTILDSGVGVYSGPCFWNGGSNAILQVWNVAGTYSLVASITATVPMTWTTGDILIGTGTYEAAS